MCQNRRCSLLQCLQFGNCVAVPLGFSMFSFFWLNHLIFYRTYISAWGLFTLNWPFLTIYGGLIVFLHAPPIFLHGDYLLSLDPLDNLWWLNFITACLSCPLSHLIVFITKISAWGLFTLIPPLLTIYGGLIVSPHAPLFYSAIFLFL